MTTHIEKVVEVQRVTALASSDQNFEARPPQGDVIAVLRSTGGAGSTTIAIECGCALAQRMEADACYLDLDLQFGNAALLLDLAPATSVVSLLEHADDIDAAFLKKVCVRHKSGLHVLAAPADIVPLEALTPKTAHRILSAAREAFPTVILDLPLAWSEWSLTLLKQASVLVIVTGLAVPELGRTARLIRGLREHGLDSDDTLLVANRVPRFFAGERLEAAEKVLGRKFAFSIVRDDDTVQEAHDRGVRLAEAGRGRVEKDMRALANGICARLAARRPSDPFRRH
jgi:pilus assembly protein CpaE